MCLPSPWDGAQKAGVCSGLMELQPLSLSPKPWPLHVYVASWEAKEALQSILGWLLAGHPFCTELPVGPKFSLL